MKVSCPHCSQRLDLDGVTLASLAGASGFECPACGGHVPLAGNSGDSGETPSPSPGGWVAPDAVELSRSFDSRYRISRLLGRGGMGAVYEGLDTRLDRRVAIKILPMETGRNMDALARFEREAKAMAALDHPNIVHIHDYGSTADGHPYFVMEFIDGTDLHGLRHSGNLDLPGALEIISQVCSALHYAHNRGIVHRDIKPANIMVTAEGVAKVADFGLAKVLGTESNPRYDPTLTLSGAAMGTPDYMAPEQLEGQPVDHRADIYSLGVMLYALLTGSPPRGAWPPPSQRVQIDVRLDEIVIRALQQNPSARYQAASEVKGDIDSVKSSTGGGPLPDGIDPEPLPSSRPSIPATHQTTSAPGHAKSKSQPVRSKSPDAEIHNSTRSLYTTMLVLGTLAILIIGGLAAYLANRKTGDTYHTEQTITSSVTNNTYFTQLIASGATTAKDLEAVTDIRPYGAGFIGISKEPLDWTGAQDLAKKTGAMILPLDRPVEEFAVDHPQWVRESFSSHLPASVWVTVGNHPYYLDNSQSALAVDLNSRRCVMLLWATSQTIDESTPLASGDKSSRSIEKNSITEGKEPGSGVIPIAPDSAAIVKATFDLLALADPARDVMKAGGLSGANQWTKSAGGLAFIPDGRAGKISAPFALNQLRDYEVEIEINSSEQLKATLDFPISSTNQATLDFRVGQNISLGSDEHNQRKVIGAWPEGIHPPWKLAGRIRFDTDARHGTIEATVNGLAAGSWHGPLYKLGKPTEEHPDFPGQLLPCLFSYSEARSFASWTLRVFAGEAKVLREGSDARFQQAPPPSPPSPLPWTNTDGKTIHAEFVRLSGETVVLRIDGKETPVHFSKLSAASVAQARKLALQKERPRDETGFVPLFNGQDLSGWRGDPRFWSVRDGVITAESPPNGKVPKNTFLIWQGGAVGDFELRLSFLIIAGNSGVQYRSETKNPATWSVKGYQYEIEAGTELLGNNGGLYEEGGSRRALARPGAMYMANAGEIVLWTKEGARIVTGNLGTRSLFRPGGWNDLTIICKGSRLLHALNGVTTVDLTDDDSEFKAVSGVLALQLHGGSPQKVLFKDIRIKQSGNF